jgi:hypothetical protein
VKKGGTGSAINSKQKIETNCIMVLSKLKGKRKGKI